MAMRPSLSTALVAPLLLLAAPPAAAQDVGVVEAAARIIEARVPGEAERPALERAAVEGMTRWLDEATGVSGNAVLSEEQHAARQRQLRGERYGLGIEFAVAAGRGLVVTGVRDGSPAHQRVQPGDVIVAMDDHPFTGLSGPAIVALVAEETRRGSGPVVLDLRRDGEALHRLSLQPAVFTVPPARVTRNDDHVEVVLDVVGEGARALLDPALRGTSTPVVLDLRDVREGELDAAVELAGLFVPAGAPVAVAVDPVGRAAPLPAAGPPVERRPLIVLVNRGTTGVAEALAAALRAHAGATLVGTRTAGVATLSSFHPIGDGLVLQLADTALRAPDGSTWAGAGLAPDLVVEPLQVPLVGPVRAAPPDIQLDAALRFVGAR